MRVGIVAQRGNERAAYHAATVREALRDADVETWVDAATAEALGVDARAVETFGDCDLVVSIGGDGTFLFAARNAGATPVLGVNLGEVGFLNAVSPDDAVAAVEREVDRFREAGAVRSQAVPRLRATAEGMEGALPPALNEVVVQAPRRGHGADLEVEVRVNGDLYAASEADGVLVATPTGSTAYNLSEGGPMVRPGVDAMVVTGMCTEAAMRPLVTPIEDEVLVRVDGAATATMASDGSSQRTVTTPAQVRVTAAAEPARVAGPGVEFFKALGKLE